MLILDTPLSPWLLMPARRSRAIWASSLSFSSFFSFSFWAIFFSTWALISTASLAWRHKQDFNLISFRFKVILARCYIVCSVVQLRKTKGAVPFCLQCRGPRPAWRSSHWCELFAGPCRQRPDVCRVEWCSPEENAPHHEKKLRQRQK